MRRYLRALITGFSPWQCYTQYGNPTEDIAKMYENMKSLPNNIEVNGAVLPCTYNGSFSTLIREMGRLDWPDIVITTGLATRVPGITIERKGRNIKSGKYHQAVTTSTTPSGVIVKRGEFSYETTIDNYALYTALKNEGLNVKVSNDAEGFVCNFIIYLLSRRIREKGPQITHGHLHFPWTTDYEKILPNSQLRRRYFGRKTTVPKDDCIKAINVAIQTAADQIRYSEHRIVNDNPSDFVKPRSNVVTGIPSASGRLHVSIY